MVTSVGGAWPWMRMRVGKGRENGISFTLSPYISKYESRKKKFLRNQFENLTEPYWNCARLWVAERGIGV